MTRRTRAVTFDFWNTLMYEGPEGLVAPRVSAWAGILEEAGLPVERARIESAHARAFDEYQEAWRSSEQYRVAEATECMLAELELSVPEVVERNLIEAFTLAGHATELRVCPGLEAGLEGLRAAGLALSIVCDIGLTPSPVLRGHLESRGLLGLFDSWAFSDEVGVYKPEPAVFLHALRSLGVDPSEAAHVGDRYRTDVVGARALGMTAIRFAGVYDDPESEGTSDHEVIDDYAALLPLLGVPADRD